MANNQKKLKAFVRYDGSGRVVASSLILRKNKPRVGRWFEIPEYLCCNGAPSSTTTTTTNGGGGGTPTAFVARIAGGVPEACGNEYGNITVVYSASTTLGIGSYLYYDAALTEPVGGQLWVKVQSESVVYTVLFGEITQVNSCNTTTTTTTQASISVGTTSESCGTPSTFVAVSFVVGSNICDTSVQLQGSFSMFPSEFYVIYGGFSRLVIKISDSIIQGAGGAPGECVSCG
jgi:hypothetical protein